MFPVLSSGGSPTSYTIQNSLRLKSSTSSYLSRTPVSTGDRQKFTWSGWVKFGDLTTVTNYIFNAQDAAQPNSSFWIGRSVSSAPNKIFVSNYNAVGPVVNNYASTSAVLNDPSAWYHIVVGVDTTQATAALGFKIYINGVLQVQGADALNAWTVNQLTYANTAGNLNLIGAYPATSRWGDMVLSEVNFIDGQALSASSFGKFNSATGVWQPAKYTGTYGTNGFYLKFNDPTLTTTVNTGVGADSSGNGNFYVSNNVSVTAGSTYDVLVDTPTVYTSSNTRPQGNYCVLNSLNAIAVPSNVNLSLPNAAASWVSAGTTMMPTTGKFYFEGFMATIGTGNYIAVGLRIPGMVASAEFAGSISNSWGIVANSTTLSSYTNNASTNITSNTATTSTAYQVAVDFDAGKIWFGYNNTWLASGNPSTGANPTYTFTANTQLQPILSSYSNTNSINFGQQPFSYTPPTGFKTLCTTNLPTSAVLKGNTQMDATLLTGTGASQTITNAAGFPPGIVWVKSTASVSSHYTFDLAGGTGFYTSSDISPLPSATNANTLTAFNSNGFTMGTGATGFNTSGDAEVAWQWRVGASAVTNTQGTLTVTLRANPTAGMSLINYTGTGVVATIGHGLGVTPALIMSKTNISGSGNWLWYHQSVGPTMAPLGNSNSVGTSINYWNNTAPGSTVYTVGPAGGTNATIGNLYYAYVFAEVAGFSKFNSYTGNGLASGPFVYLGFRPKLVMIKRTDTTGNWIIWDSSRNTYNVVTSELNNNTSSAATIVTAGDVNFLANGFKIINTGTDYNASGGTYIYCTWAENPFQNALAR